MGRLSNLKSIEENGLLVELLDNIDLSNDWEYDFIMDCAEKDFLSTKQEQVIKNIHYKLIGQYI